MLNYSDNAKALPCMIIPEVYENMMAVDISIRKYLSIIFTSITSINSMSKETRTQSFMSSQMNINFNTLIPHTEMDCLLTLIYVPLQPNKKIIMVLRWNLITLRQWPLSWLREQPYFTRHTRLRMDKLKWMKFTRNQILQQTNSPRIFLKRTITKMNFSISLRIIVLICTVISILHYKRFTHNGKLNNQMCYFSNSTSIACKIYCLNKIIFLLDMIHDDTYNMILTIVLLVSGCNHKHIE